MSIFAKLNELVNVKELSEAFNALQSEKKQKQEYKKVPEGKYDVIIEKMELTTNKEETKPMFKCQFRIINGDFKNSYLFMNQIMVADFQIKIVNDFLESLGIEKEIKFIEFEQYGNVIENIFQINKDRYEFEIDYSVKGNFDVFKVKNVYILPF